MKTFFYFLSLLLIFCSNAKSQTIQELDIRKGFKTFKIGDSKAKYVEHLKEPSKNPDGFINYKYISNVPSDYSAFNTSFDALMMTFDLKDILTSLALLKGYDSNSFNKCLTDYSSVLNGLMNLFGTPTGKNPDDKNSGRKSYFWVGENIELHFSMQYLGVQKGSVILLMIMEKGKSDKVDF